jgi:hypothetical protein
VELEKVKEVLIKYSGTLQIIGLTLMLVYAGFQVQYYQGAANNLCNELCLEKHNTNGTIIENACTCYRLPWQGVPNQVKGKLFETEEKLYTPARGVIETMVNPPNYSQELSCQVNKTRCTS